MTLTAPSEWRDTTLGEIARLYQPTTISGRDLTPHGFPVYGANGQIGYFSRFNHDASQVAVTCRGNTCGRVNYVPPKSWITGNAMVVNVDGRHDVDTRFLYHWLSAADLTKLITGSGQPQIVRGPLDSFKVALPSVPEQRRIASVADSADDLIATLERLIAKKQAIKQGMMQQLLTGKTRLPGFKGPWAEGTFEELAVPSSERARPQEVAGATPLVDLDQIEGASGRLVGTSQASDAGSLKAVFKPGDVLFGKLRAYLRKFWHADVDGLCTTEIWVLRARAGVNGRFVRFIVETDQFIEVASGAYGTHMPRSDWGTVRFLPVVIPPHDEQVAIASVIGDIDTEIGLLHQRLLKARVVKQGMMQELLTGRTRLPRETQS